MEKAHRGSFNNKDMPLQTADFHLGKPLTAEQFDRLTHGIIPKEMDDRWFIYFEDGKLYLHRSWTGHCIFIAHIEKTADAYIVGRVLANRDAEQYKQTDIEKDKDLIGNLIDYAIENRL